MSIFTGDKFLVTSEVENVTVLHLAGEIRRRSDDKPTLHQVVTAELDKGKRNFIISLKSVTFIDSFGVAEILGSYITVRNRGGRIKLACLTSKIRLLFDIIVITPPWRMENDVLYETSEAALESFRDKKKTT